MKEKFSQAAYEARIEGLFRRFQSVQTAGFGTGAYKPGLAGMLRFCDALGFGRLVAPAGAGGGAAAGALAGADVAAAVGGESAGVQAAGVPFGGPSGAGEGSAGGLAEAGVALPYPCVHVAGTNGKGSVCSMLASALATGDGIFTEPSLKTAQIRDGADISTVPSLKTAQIRDGVPISAEPFLKTGQNRNGAGWKVGLYTSPHLLDFRERMRVVTDDGWYLPSREWVLDFLEEYEPAFNGSPDASADGTHLPPLSFFEITTGMAFKWFAEQGVDCAVIEVGLGGRLDSTNVILPSLCVITSIGLDHCAILGGTRAEIASEKAGIFKPGVPAVVWGRDPETAPVFEQAAASVGCPLIFATDWPVGPDSKSAAGSAAGPSATERVLCLDEGRLLAGMDLQGPCQRQNLHTVLASLAVLTADPAEGYTVRGHAAGPDGEKPFLSNGREKAAGPDGEKPFLNIGQRMEEAAVNTVGAVEAALMHTAARTGFRGRWERFFIPLKPGSGEAAPHTAEVICDIGHNPPALAINFARLNGMIHCQGSARNGTGPVAIVYGVMADKDLAGIAPMMPAEARYFLVAPDSPRSLPASELLARLKALRPDISLTVAGSGSVAEGVAAALAGSTVAGATPTGSTAGETPTGSKNTVPSGRLVYIGGSTFVVAEAIPLLERLGTILANPAPGRTPNPPRQQVRDRPRQKKLCVRAKNNKKTIEK